MKDKSLEDIMSRSIAEQILAVEKLWDNIAEHSEQIEQNERERLQRNAQSYSTAVQQFINDMLSNSERSNLDCSVAGEEVPLWKEAMLIRKQRCSSANLQGQVFNLTNISHSLMVMQEQEFYKKNVIAVAIRKLQLLPGEQTDIYIVFGDE